MNIQFSNFFSIFPFVKQDISRIDLRQKAGAIGKKKRRKRSFV